MKRLNRRIIYLSGFTLMELMVVVIVISILVAVAIPTYTNTKEKALDKEAIMALRLIRTGNRQYSSKYDYFYPTSGSVMNLADINSNLSLDLSGANWAYRMNGTGGAFTANATRAGRTWTITQATATPTCTPAGSCL